LLVIVEQAGIDLRVGLTDGARANAPLGRMGPEFIYVPAGERAEFTLEPLHPATGKGRFRFTSLELDEGPIEQVGRALSTAGLEFGSAESDVRPRACAMYARAAGVAGLDSAWRGLARLLAASCYAATGQDGSGVDLALVADDYSFLSVQPYQATWLRAAALYAALEYGRAEGEFARALRGAQSAAAADTERAVGIAHDIAELHALLGGTLAMKAFIAGGDGTADGATEKRRLLDAAEAHLAEAIARARELGDAYVLGKAYDFRAAMHFVGGQNLQVIENLLLAKNEIAKTGNAEWLLPLLGSIGDFHKRWGELRAAQEAYLEALQIVNGNTSNGAYADTYHNAGTFYYDIGDLPRARGYLETSIELSRRTGRETRAFNNSRQLALILERQGDYAGAKRLQQELVDYFAAVDVRNGARAWSPFRIMAQSGLSRAEYKLGAIDRAWALSVEAVAQLQSRAINAGTDTAAIYINHADLLFERGERVAALATLSEVAGEYANEPIPSVDLLAGKMELLQRAGATEEAIAVANDVFAIVQSQRAEIDAVRLGPYWSGRTAEIFASHADYLLGVGLGDRRYQVRAFEVVERAKAVSLRLRRLATLLEKNASGNGTRGEWLNVVAQIQREQGRQETEQEHLAFERRLTEARERFFSAHGAGTDLPPLEIQALGEIPALLREDAVLLQFVAGPTKTWRFEVTRDGWSATPIGETAAIRALVDAATYELANPYVRGQTKTAELSSALFGGLAVGVVGKHVLISPADGMNALPFAALQIDGDYVANVATISIVPSVSEYLVGARRAAEPQQDRLELAVLADPAFESIAVPMLAMESAPAFRSWSDELQRLPASAREASELSRYYSEDRRLILTGNDATQRNFFDSRVTNAKVIHIATHGYFNETMPDLIGFAMAKADDDDDGFVSMAEISAQDFAADLVVISACSTGRGEEIAGEGNMSLARAFLAQGADAVVSTLWPVSDEATAMFMKEFYRALNEERLALDEALAAAQRALRGSGRFGDPFYWSGYTLTVAVQQPAAPFGLL
jgi:tetratricopeptide (TPR) repeat protein